MRCPVCRADSKLIHFGIYLCPNCGTTDADGRPVSPPPGTPLTPGPSSLHEAAPTPVSDDTQPTSLAFPPSVPIAPPRPLPLELAPPRPPTPLPPMAPRPMPLEVAPPHPLADPLTAVPRPEDVSRNSFAPPPPRDPRDLVTSKVGPPPILVYTLATFTIINLLATAMVEANRGGAQLGRLAAQITFSLAILSGRAWARNWSLVVNALGLLFTLLFMALPLPPIARIALAISACATGFWIYVLLRRDVTEYCK